jgi:hypothetical protein
MRVRRCTDNKAATTTSSSSDDDDTTTVDADKFHADLDQLRKWLTIADQQLPKVVRIWILDLS